MGLKAELVPWCLVNSVGCSTTRKDLTRHFVLPSYFYMSVLMHIQRNPGMYGFTAHLDVPHLHVTGSTTRTTIIWPSNGAMQFSSTQPDEPCYDSWSWWTHTGSVVARRSSERLQFSKGSGLTSTPIRSPQVDENEPSSRFGILKVISKWW